MGNIGQIEGYNFWPYIVIQIAHEYGVTFQVNDFSNNESLIISNIVFIILHIMLRFAIFCTIEQELLKIRTTFHLPESRRLLGL